MTEPDVRLDRSIRKARWEEIPQLAGVLARAFEVDPLIGWVAKDDDRRALRLVHGFTGILRFHSRGLEETYTTDALEGVALWRSPGRLGDPLADQVRIIPSVVRMAGLERVGAVASAMRIFDQRHRHHMPRPHFYLLALGVDPPAQGQGIGSRLIRPVLERCDERNTPAYLETVGEPNQRFYERHRFAVVERVPLKPAGIEVCLMRRDPR
jgi:ribosomal protein S18 acetylase RimI-like enzyme